MQLENEYNGDMILGWKELNLQICKIAWIYWKSMLESANNRCWKINQWKYLFYGLTCNYDNLVYLKSEVFARSLYAKLC